MKRTYIFWILISILIAFLSCEEEEILVKAFTASEGTYVGVVRLTYKKASGVEGYEIQRKNQGTNSWEQIAYIKGWVPDKVYDDRGIGLANNMLLTGQEYEYRMRAFPEDASASPWSSVETGYIFEPSPRMTKVQYEPDEYAEDEGVFTFTFKDPLPDNLANLNSRKIKILRAKSTTSYYSEFHTWENILGNDSTIYVSYSGDIDDAPYDYKFEFSYNYKYATVDEGGSNLNGGNADYIYQSLIVTDEDLNTTETTTYNVLNFNEINSSATGAKDEVIMCKEGTTAYLGYLDSYNMLGNGKPKLMKNTGSSWEFAGGTLPSEILNNNAIDEFDFTVSAGIIYLAALSNDTLIIYKYDGTWSANLSTSVLWGTSALQYVDIAVLSNECYVSVIQEDDVKVYKYTGSAWVQVGSTIASGFYTDTKLKEIEGTLYLWYEGHIDGSSETTLFIKHLNGSTWVDDLQWTKDAAYDFDIIKVGSNIYFKCGGGSSDFLGGVYKVTSTTTVTNLFEEGGFLHTPTSITADASGNIIASIVNGTYVTNFQLGVFVYEGSVWKKINDNYSEVSIIGSSGVHAINNDIHFVYGLKSSENDAGATILKAKKYSK
jgi:hypothetical protein